MKVPHKFAYRGTHTDDLVNLQLRFWQRAIKAFDSACAAKSEHRFCEEACLAIVDAGTSVVQLLGQAYEAQTERRTPDPEKLWNRVSSGTDLKGFGPKIKKRFRTLMKIYGDIRHFGSLKHFDVQQLSGEQLCQALTTAQDVWKLVEAIKINGGIPLPAHKVPTHLCYTFEMARS